VDTDSLIQEQIDYYRRRAPEYDETASPPGDPLGGYWEQVERAVHAFDPTGDVLEIASGTGKWTRLLLEHASSVTALDSAAEMHDESRRKLGPQSKLRYVEGDVFSWLPDGAYDVVFFASWLSHVPPPLFGRFWETVERALAPDGRVFFIDEVEDAWRNEEHLREDFVHDPSVPIVRRPLRDGGTFNVVKVFWNPRELETRLGELGWDVKAKTVGPLFWAEGSRSSRG
jgi:SAM-dependent methyltransferase